MDSIIFDAMAKAKADFKPNDVDGCAVQESRHEGYETSFLTDHVPGVVPRAISDVADSLYRLSTGFVPHFLFRTTNSPDRQIAKSETHDMTMGLLLTGYHWQGHHVAVARWEAHTASLDFALAYNNN